MTLPSKLLKQDPQEPGSQDPPPGTDTQTIPRGMTEYPESPQVTEGGLKSLRPSIEEGTHNTEHINQVIHINSVQDLTEVNLDAETLDSKSLEYQYMPS